MVQARPVMGVAGTDAPEPVRCGGQTAMANMCSGRQARRVPCGVCSMSAASLDAALRLCLRRGVYRGGGHATMGSLSRFHPRGLCPILRSGSAYLTPRHGSSDRTPTAVSDPRWTGAEGFCWTTLDLYPSPSSLWPQGWPRGSLRWHLLSRTLARPLAWGLATAVRGPDWQPHLHLRLRQSRARIARWTGRVPQ